MTPDASITVRYVAGVYVASPYGFSRASRAFYVDLIGRLKKAQLGPIDPWVQRGVATALRRAGDMAPGDARLAAFRAVNTRVAEANVRNLSRADALLAVLDGVDVDSGTASEVGFFAAAGKPIVGLRLDTRQAGDNEGATVNLQVEYFIESTGGTIVRSVADAQRELERRLRSPANASR